MDTDVLVIGAGAAGLSAALSAHDSGARVTILEKGDRLGGSASISGGIVWIPSNPQMQAAGIEDNRADAMSYFKSLDHGEMDEEVLGAFVDEGHHALAFLDSIGAAKLSMLNGYPDYYLDRPGAKPNGGRALDNDLFDFNELGPWADKVYDGGEVPRLMLRETPLGGGTGQIAPEELQRRISGDLRGWGQALVGRMLKACLDNGIEPILGTGQVELVIEDSQVVGAVFDSPEGRQKIISRQGVILATGGFEWNEGFRKTFLRGPLDAPASPPGNIGDGLKLAMGAGASLGNMTSAWWVPTLSIPGACWKDGAQRSLPVLIERTLPHTMMVNRAGKRFCNEANNYSSLAGAFHSFDPATYDYPNLPAYLIFDAQYAARYPMASVMPGDDIPDWIVSAGSIEELAEKLDIDASELRATTEYFNDNAAKSVDPEFGRGLSEYDRFYGDRSREGAAATLGAIDAAPYYAVEIKMGTLGTNGGAKTDSMARVIGHDGEPIAGLYGAGNVISCPTGSVYAGAGGTLGPALTFGYIAGRSAARRDNQ